MLVALITSNSVYQGSQREYSKRRGNTGSKLVNGGLTAPQKSKTIARSLRQVGVSLGGKTPALSLDLLITFTLVDYRVVDYLFVDCCRLSFSPPSSNYKQRLWFKDRPTYETTFQMTQFYTRDSSTRNNLLWDEDPRETDGTREQRTYPI